MFFGYSFRRKLTIQKHSLKQKGIGYFPNSDECVGTTLSYQRSQTMNTKRVKIAQSVAKYAVARHSSSRWNTAMKMLKASLLVGVSVSGSDA